MVSAGRYTKDYILDVRLSFRGKEEAVDSLQYDEFEDNILFYPPRDGNSLADIINECAEYPVIQRSYRSNREEYAGAYIKLLNQI